MWKGGELRSIPRPNLRELSKHHWKSNAMKNIIFTRSLGRVLNVVERNILLSPWGGSRCLEKRILCVYLFFLAMTLFCSFIWNKFLCKKEFYSKNNGLSRRVGHIYDLLSEVCKRDPATHGLPSPILHAVLYLSKKTLNKCFKNIFWT